MIFTFETGIATISRPMTVCPAALWVRALSRQDTCAVWKLRAVGCGCGARCASCCSIHRTPTSCTWTSCPKVSQSLQYNGRQPSAYCRGVDGKPGAHAGLASARCSQPLDAESLTMWPGTWCSFSLRRRPAGTSAASTRSMRHVPEIAARSLGDDIACSANPHNRL